MTLESIVTERNYSYVTAREENAVTASLFEWIVRVFADYGQDVYFGKKLEVVEPNMIRISQESGAACWQVLRQCPISLLGGCSEMNRKYRMP
ncbi:hypothetical protein B0O99DRAFT_621702 [Bisporella sp. PMI_857]|nr:hypothetical protein B0O99DRAFT_621702 [Bisporella sp. PMI_857]